MNDTFRHRWLLTVILALAAAIALFRAFGPDRDAAPPPPATTSGAAVLGGSEESTSSMTSAAASATADSRRETSAGNPTTTAPAPGTGEAATDTTAGTGTAAGTTAASPSAASPVNGSTPTSAPGTALTRDQAADTVQQAAAAAAEVLAEPPAHTVPEPEATDPQNEDLEGQLAAEQAAHDAAARRLAQVATGIYLESLQAQLAELADQGWRQEGEPAVVLTELVEEDLSASPPTMTVRVCVDAGRVRILDDQGRDLRGEGAPDLSWHVYDLEQRADGRWLLAREELPAEADCSAAAEDARRDGGGDR